MPEPLLRALDLTIARRVEGLLPGDHRSSLLGRGSELAQIRPYEPVEDDVRQIDWNVTARTGTPHVRIHLAERALVTWLVLDTSPSMTFGTAERRKADVAEGASLAIGYAATRRGNRLGLVTFGDEHPRTLPARQGRAGPARPAARAAQGGGRARRAARGQAATSVGEALQRVGTLARQRSYVVVVSDFRGPRDWRRPLLVLGGRHHVVAVEIRDAREQELPKFGPAAARRSRDRPPAEGRHLERAAALAASPPRPRRSAREVAAEITSAGARHVVLSTHGDWLRELTGFLRHAGAQ